MPPDRDGYLASRRVRGDGTDGHVAPDRADRILSVLKITRAIRDALTLLVGEQMAAAFLEQFGEQYPSAVACFSDDLTASLAHLRLPEGQQTYDRWFNTEKDPAKGAAILPPDAFTMGNGKRTFPEVRGPKVKRLDLMLSRLQKVGTRTLELRVEAQNALNTPQLADPVVDYNSVNFGRIITGGGERRLQLGVRLAF